MHRPNVTGVNQSEADRYANHNELSPQMIGIIIAGIATFLALATLVVAVLQLRQGGWRENSSNIDIESTGRVRTNTVGDHDGVQTNLSSRTQSIASAATLSFQAAPEPDRPPESFEMQDVRDRHLRTSD